MSMVTECVECGWRAWSAAVVWAAGATVSAQAPQRGRRRRPQAPHVGRRSEPGSAGPGHGHASRAIDGHTLLLGGLVVCALGLLFGLRDLHASSRTCRSTQSMLEISELIYETCKTYLIQQGKFLLILEALHRRHHRVLLRRRC